MFSEIKPSNINEMQKSQLLRALDVLFLAPFMIYIAHKSKDLNSIEKNILLISGILTGIYNAKNFYYNYKGNIS